MKCINCGAELLPGELFCGECGTKVPEEAPAEEKTVFAEEPVPVVEEPAVPKCNNCGAEINTDEAFCGACGAAVNSFAPSAATEPAASPFAGNMPPKQKAKKTRQLKIFKKPFVFILAGGVALVLAVVIFLVFFFNGCCSSSKAGKLNRAWVSAGSIHSSDDDSDSGYDSYSNDYIRFNEDGSFNGFTKYSDGGYDNCDNDSNRKWSIDGDKLTIKKDKGGMHSYSFTEIDENTLKTKKGDYSYGEWFVSDDYFVIDDRIFVPVSDEDFEKYYKEAANYHGGTYYLVEMSEGSTTVTEDEFSTYGYDGSTLKIDGNKATITLASTSEELTFDSENMTLTDSSGDVADIFFDGDKATISFEGVKMVFEQ